MRTAAESSWHFVSVASATSPRIHLRSETAGKARSLYRQTQALASVSPNNPKLPTEPSARFDDIGSAGREAWLVFRAENELLTDELSPSQLRAAWRKLAKRLHPDRNPGLGSLPFLRVQSAFKVLGTFW